MTLQSIGSQPVGIGSTLAPAGDNSIRTSRMDQLISTAKDSSNPVEAGKALSELDSITGDRRVTVALVQDGSIAADRSSRGGRTPARDYFSGPATIENAIDQIKHSRFGQTNAGRHVVRQLERLHSEGRIRIADQGGGVRGSWDNANRLLNVDDGMASDVNSLASELVHEATHSLLSEEYARTGRSPNGNSLDQEALTNGYQIQLYREQRSHGFRDPELERRLTASNNGTLFNDIKGRYPDAPLHQPNR